MRYDQLKAVLESINHEEKSKLSSLDTSRIMQLHYENRDRIRKKICVTSGNNNQKTIRTGLVQVRPIPPSKVNQESETIANGNRRDNTGYR